MNFKHDTSKDLTIQEQSDMFLIALLSKYRFPPMANLAVSALRAVSNELDSCLHLPSGHARRRIEDIASPASARTCFASIQHLDSTSPNRVFKKET